MLKEASAQGKFALLNEWMHDIFQEIKKDMKNDHLKNDPKFLKKYIGKPLQKIEIEDLVKGYSTAIDENPHIAEFIFQRWLLKNADIYDFFAEKLEKIDPNFTELSEIDLSISKEISEASCDRFGALKTYLFSVINSVVFPKSIYDDLNQKAQKEVKEKHQEKEEQTHLKSQEDVIKAFELKMQRTIDRYEKRLLGLEKKYHADTESLKKQISILQKKLS